MTAREVVGALIPVAAKTGVPEPPLPPPLPLLPPPPDPPELLPPVVPETSVVPAVVDLFVVRVEAVVAPPDRLVPPVIPVPATLVVDRVEVCAVVTGDTPPVDDGPLDTGVVEGPPVDDELEELELLEELEVLEVLEVLDVGPPLSQAGMVIVLVSNVTAPLRASSRPANVAPVWAEIEVRASTVPTKVVVEPKVALLPTCQKTLQAWAPLTSDTTLEEAAPSVLPAWKMNTESGSSCPSRITVPVKLIALAAL